MAGKRQWLSLLGVALVALALAGPVRADDLQDLKAQMNAMGEKIKQMEAERAQMNERMVQLETERAQSGPSLVMAAQTQKSGGLATGQTLKEDLSKGQGVRVVDTEQTKVRVYGLLDMTLFRYITNANAKGDSQFGMPVSFFSGNRWGINASQGIGSTGLSIIAKLESEFELPTGSQDTVGVLFNRDAWIGLKGDKFGQFTVGRQNTLGRDFSKEFGDPFCGSPQLDYSEGCWTNNNNFKQLIYYTGGGYGVADDKANLKTGNTRLDNGFVYKKIFKNGLALGVAFAFGDPLSAGGTNGGFVDNPAAGTVKSVALGYNGKKKKYAVSAVYTTTDVLAGKLLGNDTTKGFTHQTVGFGGNYELTKWLRWYAGYFYYTADQNNVVGQRHDNAFTTSVRLSPQKKVDYFLAFQSMHASNAAISSAAGNIANAFADVSKNNFRATGSRRNVYGAVMYHPVKAADVYLAWDYLHLYDGYRAAVTNGHSNLFEVAPGIRWRF